MNKEIKKPEKMTDLETKMLEVLRVANYPEEPNCANMNENLVWEYKERLDKIIKAIQEHCTSEPKERG